MRTLAATVGLTTAVWAFALIDPSVSVVALGAAGLLVAVYGLRANGRFHLHRWHLAWSSITFGLACVASSTLLHATHPDMWTGQWNAAVAFTLVGELFTVIGLVLLIHQRLPGRSVDALGTAAIGALAFAFVVLSFVIVPAYGWHPGLQLPHLAIPFLDLVVIWLAVNLVSLTRSHPVGYRYMIAGFFCLFIAHAIRAALLLSGGQSVGNIQDAFAVVAVCLWSVATVHPSQRAPFDPVPLRSTRPSWLNVSVILLATGTAPAIIALQSSMKSTSMVSLEIGVSILPLIIVAYLVYQVFARSAAEYRAQHDTLTGVCNRTLFDEHLEKALVEAERNGKGLAVLFLDLDRFKTINDSLGHSIGNQLLQAVVRRLQGRLRPQDTLSRLGGDEFTILVPDIEVDEGPPNLAERILAAFAEPFNIGGRQLPVQASIGIAMYPGAGNDPEVILKNADTAMYQAKALGRNTYVVYDSTMSRRAQLRFSLESSLRCALEEGQLSVHYQPKLATRSRHIVGFEALARWKHPDLGYIPPSAFIRLAEESSLISDLGEWVLETACSQAKRWHDMGLSPLPVAVNISPRQFTRSSIVEVVKDVLGRTGLDPTLLELEVTESVLVDHMDDTAASLQRLRSMGIRCSIDDFGTGYSALTYLAQMPADAIKIDPTFVRRIDGVSGAEPIVGAVIALAHNLNLQVIAEGVETDSQLSFLHDHACDYVQGFRFSPALSAEVVNLVLLTQKGLLWADGWGPEQRSPEAFMAQSRLTQILTAALSEGGWPDNTDEGEIELILAALDSSKEERQLASPVLESVPRLAIGALASLTRGPHA